jgi:hypothetical protein
MRLRTTALLIRVDFALLFQSRHTGVHVTRNRTDRIAHGGGFPGPRGVVQVRHRSC